MTILNIFHTGGLTLGLIIVFLILEGILGYQYYKEIKAGVGATKSHFLKFMIVVLVAFIVAMIFVGSDYKGV